MKLGKKIIALALFGMAVSGWATCENVLSSSVDGEKRITRLYPQNDILYFKQDGLQNYQRLSESVVGSTGFKTTTSLLYMAFQNGWRVKVKCHTSDDIAYIYIDKK